MKQLSRRLLNEICAVYEVRDAVLQWCSIVKMLYSWTNIHNEEGEADGHVSDDIFVIQLMKMNHLNILTNKTSYILCRMR